MNREEIIQFLRSYKEHNMNKYSIIKIGLFGSVARGRINDESDIDVVVELGKQDLFSLIGIKQELEEQLHQSVDVISYRKNMNQFLRRRIDNEAVYV